MVGGGQQRAKRAVGFDGREVAAELTQGAVVREPDRLRAQTERGAEHRFLWMVEEKGVVTLNIILLLVYTYFLATTTYAVFRQAMGSDNVEAPSMA